MHLSFAELMGYTAEERERWRLWFLEQGDQALAIPLVGSDEKTAGGMILHIFGAEMRWIQRLRGETLMEYRGRFAADKLKPLFALGAESRTKFEAFVQETTPEGWARVNHIPIGDRDVRATTRKIVGHMLVHEIRHWSHLTRAVRQQGLVPSGNHDLLWSDALE